MDELLEDFISETHETLEALSGQLIEWEKNPQDKALVDSVFRFVHTVKGSCGFLDLPRLLKLSHAAEDILSDARDGRIMPTAQLVSAVLAIIDKISDITNAMESGASVVDNDEQLISSLLSHISSPKKDAQKAAPVKQEIVAQLPANSEKPQKNRSVRLSLNLLDTLMNGVSDMVLARNDVSRQLRKIGADSELEHAFAKLSSSVAELRDAIGLMRMQPIEQLFASLPRLVRDLSLDLGKEIKLQLEGSEVEVDREMVEAVRDPLVHILRNAVDHGIETPSERIAAGKNREGIIKVSARQSGNQILLEITDDGRGINIDSLCANAMERGLVDSAEWQKMSDTQRLETIFLPGLSTAGKVTSISGRGVGMDVVKNNLQSIGASIDLDNIPGQALTITMRLPLTLSIIAGLSVRAAGQVFGIARSAVVEILSVKNSQVQLEEIGGRDIATVRGTRLACCKLEDILEIEPDYETAQANDENRILVIINPAVGAKFVLNVAAVIDNEELVIKPGPPMVMDNGLYAGTTLPDNGRPMLLLDPSGIATQLGVSDCDPTENIEAASVSVEDGGEAAICFMRLNGKRQAIRLTSIDRLEEVDARAADFVGGKWRVNVDGQLTDLIGLDDHAAPDKLQLIRLNDGDRAVCLAIDYVIDIFQLPAEMIASETPELHEAIVKMDGEFVELLNIYQFFEDNVDNGADHDNILCFVDTEQSDHWEKQILQPLLKASGYQVSFDEKDRNNAQIIISRNAEQDISDVDDGRMLVLRDQRNPRPNSIASIFRYDRIGLISAIEEKLSGAL